MFCDLGCSSSSSSKKDNDALPIKSGTIADLDEESERADDSQPSKASTEAGSQVNRKTSSVHI